MLARLREKKKKQQREAALQQAERAPRAPLSRAGGSSTLTVCAASTKVERESTVSTVKSGLVDYDLQKAIVRQIEYYFGDYNLPRDKYILDLMKEDSGISSYAVGVVLLKLQYFYFRLDPDGEDVDVSPVV